MKVVFIDRAYPSNVYRIETACGRNYVYVDGEGSAVCHRCNKAGKWVVRTVDSKTVMTFIRTAVAKYNAGAAK